MALDVSPDGETIVFDLLGDLYVMPAEGGDGVPLTTGRAWDQSPRFSPDGQQVFFISDRAGHKNLWRASLIDQSVRQVTRLDRPIMGAINWTRDGQHLLAGIAAFGLDYQRGAEVLLHSIDPSSGAMAPIEPWAGPLINTKSGFNQRGRVRLRPRTHVYSGVGHAADGRVFFSESVTKRNAEGSWQLRIRIYEFDTETNARIHITPEDAPYSEFKPLLSRDGNFLAYYRQYDDRRTELRILELGSRQDRLVTGLEDAEDAWYSTTDDQRPNYAFTPDDNALVFWHAGKIRHVGLADGVSEVVPFRVNVKREVAVRAEPAAPTIKAVEDARTIRWPSLTRDGETLIFAAAGFIWVKDVSSGDVRRLTTSDEYEFMPSISPDGSSVAYVSVSSSWKEYQRGSTVSGRLMVADIGENEPRELLSESRAQFLLPEWSDDGTKIATMRYAAADGVRRWAVGWTGALDGGFNEVLTLPNRYVFPEGRSLYSRWVGFDRAGEHLLFSYPVTPEKMVLATAELNGGGFRALAIGASDVGGIVPSPDLKQLMLTRRDGTLWLAPFALEPEPGAISTLTLEASRLSEKAGYYPVWYGDQQLSFGFGTEFYHRHLPTKKQRSHSVNLSIKRPTSERPIVFRGARLVTLSERDRGGVIENGVLLVEQGRIMAVGEEDNVVAPDDAVVINAVGKTIVPGFIDTHYHSMGGTASHNLPFAGRFGDSSAIEYGVTSAWNPGGKYDDGATAHYDVHTAGRLLGPRWSYASQYFAAPFQLLTRNYEKALATVERYKDLGVTVIKESGISTREQQQWASAAARHHDVGIVSHLARFDQTMTRVIDGYTGGDHPYMPAPFYEDVHQLLVQTGFVWTPHPSTTPSTISTSRSRSSRGGPISTYYCDAVAAGKRQGTLGDTKASSFCNEVVRNENLPNFDLHRVGRVAKQAAIAAGNGASIGVSGHDMPGRNLHMDMWALWRGGMPVEDVLRSTSLVNAEKLGLQHEIGSLEVGKVADFVVLDGNPLENIINTMSLRYTVQFGVIYDSKTAEPVDPETLAATVH